LYPQHYWATLSTSTPQPTIINEVSSPVEGSVRWEGHEEVVTATSSGWQVSLWPAKITNTKCRHYLFTSHSKALCDALRRK
jgi:hypothetical protein